MQHSEAIVEIRSKAALLRTTGKRLMRCRHNPDIHPNRLILAHTLQFSTLQKTQQLGLKRQRHLADLVQEQRTAVCRFNPSRPALHRACECAPGVAEKLSL